MSRRNFGIKNFFFSFVTVCIVLYIFQNSNGSAETIVAEIGTLEDIIKANGIVVKDEEVYSANLDGNVTYYHEDGDKIKEGDLVAELNSDLNATQINSQITELQNVIDLKNNKGLMPQGQKLSSEDITTYQLEIQSSILNDDIENMYKIFGQVNNNGVMVFSDNKYEDYDVEQLESMKDNLSKSIETNKIPYYSAQPGIITYKIDGLEDVYRYENVLDMTPSTTIKKDYTLTDSSQKQEIFKGDNLYKIIRNFNYYITITVDNEYAKLFNENKYIKTRILYDGTQHEVWGYIEKINYGSEESVLILYFDDYFYKIYDKRYIDIELITDIHEGIKIKTKAITQKDGITGVYIEDASNIIKFFPVEILGQDDTYTVVSIGSYVSEKERRTINIDDNTYYTIKIFDKVIIEPENVYEGQIAK
ncbi:HlyD family efflux transporter periplasmic adaptor subunit [Sedimentibacter sp. MB31-C6]|uniref:HlyD family efflux transporter periplasmic adaptor subunit n=1 Tax=Sedimentibacter sp. MB31-C6 TaxID=3109366 RepID=UPI002DDD74DD|nr:HlyD family efflux transporter periplasmic adaptor subunit [Sedimentibacter sp. MB36-C1]WSI04343.1 HlyD family efflux transporter periplasmic adaptor subunit [Sedimentibacter sp. MB36-C1]